MREQVLAAFFKGSIDAPQFARDLEGSVKRVGEIGALVEIEDMNGELEVSPEMAIALCDVRRSVPRR